MTQAVRYAQHHRALEVFEAGVPAVEEGRVLGCQWLGPGSRRGRGGRGSLRWSRRRRGLPRSRLGREATGPHAAGWCQLVPWIGGGLDRGRDSRMCLGWQGGRCWPTEAGKRVLHVYRHKWLRRHSRIPEALLERHSHLIVRIAVRVVSHGGGSWSHDGMLIIIVVVIDFSKPPGTR